MTIWPVSEENLVGFPVVHTSSRAETRRLAGCNGVNSYGEPPGQHVCELWGGASIGPTTPAFPHRFTELEGF